MSTRANISDKDAQPEPKANSYFGFDTCPTQMSGSVANVLKKSKEHEKMSNSYELLKYCTDPSLRLAKGVMRILVDGK